MPWMVIDISVLIDSIGALLVPSIRSSFQFLRLFVHQFIFRPGARQGERAPRWVPRVPRLQRSPAVFLFVRGSRCSMSLRSASPLFTPPTPPSSSRFHPTSMGRPRERLRRKRSTAPLHLCSTSKDVERSGYCPNSWSGCQHGQRPSAARGNAFKIGYHFLWSRVRTHKEKSDQFSALQFSQIIYLLHHEVLHHSLGLKLCLKFNTPCIQEDAKERGPMQAIL